MKLHICSDLHLSHYKENISFLDSFNSDGIDVCIVAGDIGESDSIEPGLTKLCEKYPDVIYVLGNHEYYSSDRAKTLKIIGETQDKLSNLCWLENNKCMISGYLFAGATLWFPWDPFCAVYAREWSDFRYIRGLKEWVFEQNKISKDYLGLSEPRVPDVIITHYAPSHQSIIEKYQGNPYNRFFVCDMEEIILANQMPLWVHGHVHSNHDYKIDRTRVVCHPRGYPREELHREYQPLLVEI